jgi:hypothetical protein
MGIFLRRVYTALLCLGIMFPSIVHIICTCMVRVYIKSVSQPSAKDIFDTE